MLWSRLVVHRLGLYVTKDSLKHGVSIVPMDDAPIILASVLVCPNCKHSKLEEMPANYCLSMYECENCRAMLRPKQGDCCVFCSYGSAPCPPIQQQNRSTEV
jgi:hypothetical protein